MVCMCVPPAVGITILTIVVEVVIMRTDVLRLLCTRKIILITSISRLLRLDLRLTPTCFGHEYVLKRTPGHLYRVRVPSLDVASTELSFFMQINCISDSESFESGQDVL